MSIRIPAQFQAGGKKVDEHPSTRTFLATAAASACGFGALFALARRVLGGPLRAHGLPASRRLFVAQTAVSLVHACLSGPAALRALCDLWGRGLVAYPDVAVTRGGTTEMGAKAIALTSGYLGFDAAVMALFPAHTAAEQGGAAGVALMWLHHGAALAFMPYAAVTGRGLFVSLLAQVTEFSNIGQNLYLLLARGRLGPAALRTAVGLAWAVLFFAFRVAPIVPWIRDIYRAVVVEPKADGEVPPFDRVFHGIMMPLPVVLNLYWFSMILKRVVAGVGAGHGRN